MVTWWQGQLAGLHVTVHRSCEITASSTELIGADEIVVAVGSVQIHPASIAGIERDDVVDVLQFHQGSPVGRRVLVVGGGLFGADAALEMTRNGHEVTIVELAEEVAPDMLIGNKLTLLRELAEAGVTLLTRHAVTAIDDDGLLAAGAHGEVWIPADMVVLALGNRPVTALV